MKMLVLCLFAVMLGVCFGASSHYACDDRAIFQSTTGQWGDIVGHARLAVDGNKDTNWWAGSCTHTLPDDQDPFLSLDLGCSKKLAQVILTNRMDCCTNRLRDFEIILTDVPYTSECRHQVEICAYHSGSFENTKAINCVGEGRFVTIRYKSPADIPDSDRRIHICEMEVKLAPEPKTADSHTACDTKTEIQSSTGKWGSITGYAHLATDGNKDTNWWSGSCTHTAPNDVDPFLSLDLGCSKKLAQVILTNRMDCCTDRLRDFEIVLTEAPYSPDCRGEVTVCADHPGYFKNTQAIDCVGTGRFVTIRYKSPSDIPSGDRYLHICEMEVKLA